ncbi:MAG: TerB family tellurite resistance protein [Candidatus Riflebacteria bacterium]|nr:TerB family tellurite resistance protein [Candidatus Riflebacteria bacterium]
MKTENIRLLLITKIPLEVAACRDIIQALRDAFADSRLDDVFTILRASYMSVTDLEKRSGYYLDLVKTLVDLLPGKPQVASGQPGLYIGFIAEDLIECSNPKLVPAGHLLQTAQRSAGNPTPIVSGDFEMPSLGALPFPPESVANNPGHLIELLLAQEAVWKEPSFKPVRERLSRSPVEVGPRDRASALVSIGTHLEKTPQPDWAQACYYAAGAIDPSFDLPWAFLAHFASDSQKGLVFAQQAIRANSKSKVGLTNRGVIWTRLGKYSLALRDFAAVARFESGDPKILLMTAHAAADSGHLARAAALYLLTARTFPILPEPWHGLARLFMIAGLPENARLYQEQCRSLMHGNVPRELRLCGCLRLTGPDAAIVVSLDGVDVDLDMPRSISMDVTPGQHIVVWKGGVEVSKFMVDEGEGIHLAWTASGSEVNIRSFIPEPGFFADPAVPDARPRSARDILAPWMVETLDRLPAPGELRSLLGDVEPPVSPFAGEGRLTMEGVFSILLEEILADGVFDRAESELLRAVRDRLMIENSVYSVLMEEARIKAEMRTRSGTGQKNSAGSLEPLSLYRRLVAKALEDGRIEPAERGLLEAVAEALLLSPDELAAIEHSFK